MVKILLVVPYEEVQEKFERYVSTLDTRDMEIDICHLYGSRFSIWICPNTVSWPPVASPAAVFAPNILRPRLWRSP